METRQRVERCVPDASVICIENAGHILPPQTAAVGDFLKGTSHVDALRSPISD